MISKEEGKKLLALAKKSVVYALEGEELSIDKEFLSKFCEDQGCFVTIHKKDELRGCIGFPEPVMPLYKGICQAAYAAAFDDPRFPAVEKSEFKELKFEISVLTKPELLKVKKAEEYISKVKVGRDGLIIRSPYGSGLLLPQVATEYKWDSKQFLEHTSQKAGLPKDSWKEGSSKIYIFQAQVFSE